MSAAAAADWAAENAFEFIPLPAVDAAQPAEASSSRERVGLARVREALEAHNWPGLLPKPRAVLPRAGAEAASDAAPSLSTKTLLEADEEAVGEEAYEALMGAMRQARDVAAAGGVPDEERRARAATLALQMAALLGFDDGDETEEGEDEED